MDGPSDVTALLLAWSDGREDARDQLIPLVYDELRRVAANRLDGERREHTLQPTALVHEVYQKLIDQRRVQWRNRAHFFAVAATLMRRILIDHARRRRAQRRGGAGPRVELDEEQLPGAPGPDADLIALDDALAALAEIDAGQARIVELRFFAGLSVEDTADALGVSPATVYRDWSMARAWLRQRLSAA